MKKHLISAILAICLTAYAINVRAQVGSNIVSGLLHTLDSVSIYVDVLVDGSDGVPGRYERVYSGTFIDSYTFKVPSYRDVTVQYCTRTRCKVFKIVEGGESENFHEIDVHFNRNVTSLSYKLNASAGGFKVVNIRTRY